MCLQHTFIPQLLLQAGDWEAEKVISIIPKKVEGWALPVMPGTLVLFFCVFLVFL